MSLPSQSQVIRPPSLNYLEATEAARWTHRLVFALAGLLPTVIADFKFAQSRGCLHLVEQI